MSPPEGTEDQAGPELRLALAMRGGVSLSVWIGGACVEIDELRRAESTFWGPLAQACGYSKVVVDVMAGASAGGLNGVLFAASMRHGFRLGPLKDIWRTTASVDRLRRTGEPWWSLFDGDGAFLEEIRARLGELIGAADPPEEVHEHPIDLQLTATLIEPRAVPTASPSDEDLVRQRFGARFHFRHEPWGLLPRRDLGPLRTEGEADALTDAVARLALAARATASYPGAFEAAVVRSTRAVAFGADDTAHTIPALVDCRDVFSERRGRPSADGELHATDFVVADGGIVDNIPLGRALAAVAAAPADRRTERKLLYLHPTGPAVQQPAAEDLPEVEPQPESRRRAARAVLEGTVRAAVQVESIDADIAQLEQHNRTVRMRSLLRRTVLEGLDPTDPSVPPGGWDTYRIQRPAADAARLRRLLDDPMAVLDGDPFPQVRADPVQRQGRWTSEVVWLAPLAPWSDVARTCLDETLTATFGAQLEPAMASQVPGAALRVGLGPLRRTIALALEWLRSLPATDLVGHTKRAVYDLRAVVAALEQSRRLAWVILASRVPDDEARFVPGWPTTSTDVEAWCTLALDGIDRVLVVSQDLADALVTAGPDDQPRFQEAGRELRNRTDRALQRFIDAERPTFEAELSLTAGDTARTVDLRQPILDRLAELLLPVVLDRNAERAAGADTLPEPGASELIDLVLAGAAPPSDRAEVIGRLASLEGLCLAEHLMDGGEGPEIELVRISAMAATPLAGALTELRTASAQLVATGPEDPEEPVAAFLHPEVKLAGTAVNNFGAFLREEWRSNDWMWGRLDAASGLVDLLLAGHLRSGGPLPPEVLELAGCGPGAGPAEVRSALIERRQREIAAEELSVEPSELDERLATYDIGTQTLRTVDDPEVGSSLAELVSVASQVVGEELPARARFLARPLGHVGGWAVRALVGRPRSGIRARLGRVAVAGGLTAAAAVASVAVRRRPPRSRTLQGRP